MFRRISSVALASSALAPTHVLRQCSNTTANTTMAGSSSTTASPAATDAGKKTEESAAADASGAASSSSPAPSNDSNNNAPVKNEFGKVDPNAGPLKVNDDGEFEPMRWIQEPYQDPALAPIVDEQGQYIVSKGDWPTGEMAYRPLPRTDITPRFGYNIVSVKKPQTYWQYWRKHEHFNYTYLGIQAVFILGMTWLMGMLYEEIRHYEAEGKTAGNQAGEVRGKGRTDRKKVKIEFTKEEQDAFLMNAQNSYIDGEESKFLGNRDYKMKKIARPEEYDYTDFRKR